MDERLIQSDEEECEKFSLKRYFVDQFFFQLSFPFALIVMYISYITYGQRNIYGSYCSKLYLYGLSELTIIYVAKRWKIWASFFVVLQLPIVIAFLTFIVMYRNIIDGKKQVEELVPETKGDMFATLKMMSSIFWIILFSCILLLKFVPAVMFFMWMYSKKLKSVTGQEEETNSVPEKLEDIVLSKEISENGEEEGGHSHSEEGEEEEGEFEEAEEEQYDDSEYSEDDEYN